MQTTQQEIGIQVEKFTERETKIRRLLRDYLKMDDRIEYLTRLANGDDLIHEPRITAAPQIEDDPWVVAQLATQTITQPQADMLKVVLKYVDADSLVYASSVHVAKRLRNKFADDQDEDRLLQMFYNMLMEKLGEERVELTDTERLSILREVEIDRARQKLKTEYAKKRWMDYAIGVVQRRSPYFYTLLWHKHVLNKPVSDVCEVAGIEWPRNVKTYDKHIRQAMEEISHFIPESVLSMA